MVIQFKKEIYTRGITKSQTSEKIYKFSKNYKLYKFEVFMEY